MIQVNDLHFAYGSNSHDTLRGLNFHVDTGEIFGFLGPSGAGKSTTQKILIGILNNYRGAVQVNGLNLQQLNSEFYESIGVAFETPNLYSKFTALENLDFFAQFYSSEARNPLELLAAVGLEEAAKTRVSDFSKGMKVRLNFCRSLLNNPKLLFLDEPTAGLDPVNLRKMEALILAEKTRGNTICITTHDMHVADTLCDRVAFIVDGEVSLIDSPRDLKLQHGERFVDIEYREGDSLQTKSISMEKLGTNDAFQNILNNQYIETIHSREASLEDVFVKTTGRSLQ
ncbi:MAG: ABC transporter ATP-binding protein [FCB group bacterium]|nr:ABC transporter ATP-binding protein [FCB group bacterium]MBL7028718.1 ABC transporter ATP-binding protein [Candidatus Neomarinimicrobiota bacterium]MBL7120678.1 ABC transporter ATP-binding protein [Candidatus Neomarinimicrobiota bacterium]